MPQTHETPPLVGAGLLDNYSLAGNDIENTSAQFAAQAVCAALQRDFLAEALRVAEVAGESQPPIAERLLSSNALRQQRFRERQAALRNVTEPLQVTDVTGGNGGERES